MTFHIAPQVCLFSRACRVQTETPRHAKVLAASFCLQLSLRKASGWEVRNMIVDGWTRSCNVPFVKQISGVILRFSSFVRAAIAHSRGVIVVDRIYAVFVYDRVIYCRVHRRTSYRCKHRSCCVFSSPIFRNSSLCIRIVEHVFLKTENTHSHRFQR